MIYACGKFSAKISAHVFLIKRNSFKLKAKIILFSLGLAMCFPASLFATHINGADMSYKWISGNTFGLTITLYRNCSGISAPASVSINYKSVSCGYNLNIGLNRVPGTGQEISLSCDSIVTICAGGTAQGVQKYEYYGTVTLPARCTDWVFSYSICCRNCAITTLSYTPSNCTGVPGTYVEATLNNLLYPDNSSPVFTNVPVSLFCIGQPFHYNHGAYDANGDSLVYSFINPRSGSNTDVTFKPGYSASSPVSSTPPVTLNASGDITINPTALENGVMAILVREYRNGVLIGSVVRDMEMWTYTCTNNLPAVSGINGTNDYTMQACPGRPINFNIFSSDADAAQRLQLSWNNAIPGATFTSPQASRPVGTFSWTPTFAHIRSQPYTFLVTVKDNNCPANGSQTYSFSITVQNLSVSVQSANSTCAAPGNGSATAIPVGAEPFSYAWSPTGSTAASISGLTAGNYTVIVTNGNGCTVSATATITSPAPLRTILVPTNSSCFGSNSGMITANVNGGTPPYSYQWLPTGGNASTASGLSAGTYSVRITDANGCTQILGAAITEPRVLAAVSSVTPATCFGAANGLASLSVSGGTLPYRYNWSNGSTSQSISALSAGTYSVLITDARGCTVTRSVLITQPAALTVSASASPAYCGNQNGTAIATVSGGTGPYSYSWTNVNSDSASAHGLNAGAHTVIVTDNKGCVATRNFSVPDVPSPTATVSSLTHVGCHGENNGSAEVTVQSGQAPYSYTWSHAANNSPSASGLAAGNYTVTATDRNNCSVSVSFQIQQPMQLTVAVAKQDPSCHGNSNGTAIATASGGTGRYSYQWSNGAASPSINSLGAGSYTITVRDENFCNAFSSFTINQPVQINLTTSMRPSDCGSANGSAAVSVFGGSSPYQFAWSPGGMTVDSVSGLAAGTYQVTVTDARNCSMNSQVTITNNSGPVVTLGSATAVTCVNLADGTASVNITGGTGNKSINWLPYGGNASTAVGLAAGLYSVEVRDSNNCLSSITVMIPAADPISATIIPSHAPCPGSTGSAASSVTGGKAPYSYSWSSGATTATTTGLSRGIHTLTVTDANNCSAQFQTFIDEPQALRVLTSTRSVTCFNGADGFASVNVTGGTPGYTYAWSHGANTSSLANLSAGIYSVVISDATGCRTDTTLIISQPSRVNLSVTQTDISCPGRQDGEAEINVTGGYSPYTFEWGPFGGTDSIERQLAPGSYMVKVRDQKGCLEKIIVTINSPDSLKASLSSVDASCFAGDDGQASATINGGYAPYSYLWSTGSHSSSATNLAAGAYSVLVTDNRSCTLQETVIINHPPELQLMATSPQAICIGQEATLTASCMGGTPGYTYLWSTGATQSSTSVAPAQTTTYAVTGTDINGCTATVNVIASVHPAILASVVAPDTVCEGQSATLNISGSGGNGGPYVYAWSSGHSGSELMVTLNADSVFYVTVYDGCGTPPVTQSVAVKVNPNPVANFLPEAIEGCEPLLVDFSDVSFVNGATHQWQFGDGMESHAENPKHLYASAGSYSVSHTVTSKEGCTGKKTISDAVIVHPVPVAAFSNSPESASINVPVISFFDESINAMQAIWDFGDGSGIVTGKNTVHTYSDTGTYYVTLVSVSKNNCLDTITKPVLIRSEFAVYIPNAFTPNGDGINERFMALGVGVNSFEMEIYNRWGQNIFRSNHLDESWNGRHASTGDECQVDVYVYIIMITDNQNRSHRYVGHVNLIR